VGGESETSDGACNPAQLAAVSVGQDKPERFDEVVQSLLDAGFDARQEFPRCPLCSEGGSWSSGPRREASGLPRLNGGITASSGSPKQSAQSAREVAESGFSDRQ